MNREAGDKIAWDTLHARPPFPGGPAGLAVSDRPANFSELYQQIKDGRDWELAWSEYLHEFFRYKSASFFEVEPPDGFSPAFRALFAGTAEFLCREFGLDTPVWVEKKEYFLPEVWEPWGEIMPDDAESIERRKAKMDSAFLRRNVLFASRNLITL
jgi:hypothetical protein